MINFINQALTKRQMNSVRGGAQASYTYECVAFMDDGTKVIYHPTAENPFDAADQVHAQTGAGQVNCVKING